ncbi:MAG TPA: hypothetical protein VFK78_11360 [Gemmatimonadales bacterium]|nr:hypothetical protein [Gemmatimonadales bacterium]
MVAGAVAACSDRPRPGPPRLSITLDETQVHSPDTLTGTLDASDPDGIDSIWLTVDSTRAGDDGLLQENFGERFALPVQSGHTPGFIVGVRLEARDVSGYTSSKDTSVVVF